MDISVIIPTLNAEHEIDRLLIALEHQSIQPVDILIVDSASEDKTIELVRQHKRVRLLKIDRQDFNHGTTRDMALRESRGDFVCFLTQDAVPVSDDYLERLVAPMIDDSDIALVSGRQLPKADGRRFEQLVRGFNYPDWPSVRSKYDLEKLGIKTFFASDACSAYRRTAYLECGGFEHVNTNEDMLMAARFIASGLKVAYEPRAEVYHSHNLTPSQQFARNALSASFSKRMQTNSCIQVRLVKEAGSPRWFRCNFYEREVLASSLLSESTAAPAFSEIALAAGQQEMKGYSQ